MTEPDKPDIGSYTHERETVISSDRVYAGRIFTVDVDHVRLGNGRESMRDVVRHCGASLIVPVLEDNRLIMVRQFRYAIGEILVELPAGKLDVAGEAPLECAQRELAEETGYAAQSWHRLGFIYTSPGFCDERIHCFLALGLQRCSVKTSDSEENIEIVHVTYKEAMDFIASGAICDAKTIAGLSMAHVFYPALDPATVSKVSDPT